MNSSQHIEVKAFFEQTEVYLTYNYNLRIRTETLSAFIGDAQFDEVLDMPCGTGDITLPLLSQFEHLTLMDFSSNMVELARKNTPAEFSNRVTYHTTDFYDHHFGNKQYDLVVCLGILAHIERPFDFLASIEKLVKPGGLLVLQNTDSHHWFSRFIYFYLALKRLVGKDKYRLNTIPAKELLAKMDDMNFELQSGFGYNQSFLGLSRLFSNSLKYKLTRALFGYAMKGKVLRKGSDHTYLFQKEHD